MSDHQPITRVSAPLKKKKRSSALARLLAAWFLSLLVIAVVFGGALVWAWASFDAPGPLKAKTVVQLPKDADRMTVAAILHDKGVISNAAVFSGAAAIGQVWRHARLKPGEYEFPADASMRDVLAMMVAGQFLRYKIPVPEGLTSQAVVDRLNQQEELDGQVTQVPAEGSLLPATWEAVRGDSRQQLLDQMAAAQSKLMDDVMARLPADSVLKTRQDVITLASIVEKETGVPEERPVIAAVFLNRLKQHMRLQTDPTVIYGIVGGAGKLDHALTRDELDAPTPYNTYTNDGLPPGPIANPGKAAIEAVIAPANVPYLYFVANGSGGHAFATTLDEHNANVKKWRAFAAQADASAAQPAPAAQAAATPPKPAGTVPVPVPAPGAPAAGATPVANTVIVNGKKVPLPVFKKPVN